MAASRRCSGDVRSLTSGADAAGHREFLRIDCARHQFSNRPTRLRSRHMTSSSKDPEPPGDDDELWRDIGERFHAELKRRGINLDSMTDADFDAFQKRLAPSLSKVRK